MGLISSSFKAPILGHTKPLQEAQPPKTYGPEPNPKSATLQIEPEPTPIINNPLLYYALLGAIVGVIQSYSCAPAGTIKIWKQAHPDGTAAEGLWNTKILPNSKPPKGFIDGFLQSYAHRGLAKTLYQPVRGAGLLSLKFPSFSFGYFIKEKVFPDDKAKGTFAATVLSVFFLAYGEAWWARAINNQQATATNRFGLSPLFVRAGQFQGGLLYGIPAMQSQLKQTRLSNYLNDKQINTVSAPPTGFIAGVASSFPDYLKTNMVTRDIGVLEAFRHVFRYNDPALYSARPLTMSNFERRTRQVWNTLKQGHRGAVWRGTYIAGAMTITNEAYKAVKAKLHSLGIQG